MGWEWPYTTNFGVDLLCILWSTKYNIHKKDIICSIKVVALESFAISPQAITLLFFWN